MKKNSILFFAFLIFLAVGFQTAPAQFTISIPKIPKIKKDQPVETQQTAPDNVQTNPKLTYQCKKEK